MSASEKDWVHIIWNNKDIRIDKKPIFYKNYYDSGIIIFVICNCINISVKGSFHLIFETISKTNFLVWAGLRHSIPHSLRSSTYNAAIGPLQLILEDNIFDVSQKKFKDYYKRLVGRKAQFPKSINKLQNNFNLSLQQLTEIFQLPHTVALEPYVKAFQYKVRNGILYTSFKLYQIGYISSDLCSFCTRTSETLYHLFYFCPFSKTFWSDFESFWHLLTNKKMQLSLQDIVEE